MLPYRPWAHSRRCSSSDWKPCGRLTQAPSHHRRRPHLQSICRAVDHAASIADAFQALEVDRHSSKDEIRAAYLCKMKRLHPDVHPEADTTAAAACVTVAYHQLMQGFLDGSIDDLSHEDVFDSPEAEPDQIFINPFACSVNPLDWRQLQQVAGACGQEELCEAELLRQGVYMQSSSAVCWLTPGQLAGVVADLTAMESNLNFEITSWLVNDCLVRAERANNRMPVTWR